MFNRRPVNPPPAAVGDAQVPPRQAIANRRIHPRVAQEAEAGAGSDGTGTYDAGSGVPTIRPRLIKK